MKTIIKYLLLILIFFSIQLYSQYSVNIEIIEPPMPELTSSGQLGGRYITSIAENGRYVRILIVFVQFKDDNWNPTWNEWPKNSAPTNWMNTNIIDQWTTQSSTNQNLSHYYTAMSLGRYKIIGNTYHKITTNTRAEYISMNYDRGDINKQILQEMDSFINYSLYDNWNKVGAFSHSWGADSEVDMIWMVYRNVVNDLPDPLGTATILGFGDPFNGIYSGEASLGGGTDINMILNVDGGLRTIDLRGYGLVSGITIMNGYNGFGLVKNVIVHEFGHHLVGGNEAHFSNSGLWGMMAGYGSRSQMINSYERHRLLWITFMQYDFNPAEPISLSDFLTTNQALRIKIPGSSPARYYLLENHQRQSVFDNMDMTTGGKGIYVIYQSGPDGNDLTFYNAEGRNIWSFDHCAIHPTVGVLVPVFQEGIQNWINGKFDTEILQYNHCISGNTAYSPIEAYINPLTGQDEFIPLFRGDGRDMLNPGYMEVFNPKSNPFVENLSFYIIKQSNQLKVIQKVESGTIYNTPPSKPQNLLVVPSQNNRPFATWDANQEPDIMNYKLWKKKFYGGAWHWDFLIQTSNNYYEDISETYCSNPPVQCGDPDPIYYRVEAVDNQLLISVPSDSALAVINGGGGGEDKISVTNISETPVEYVLDQNYPNPFNPTTTINYSIKSTGLVTLKVYDLLGSKVASLVNEVKEAGSYSVNFNASELPSGIYFYTLTSGNFNSTKKLILLK
jgi:hypothetical protein